MGRPAERRWWVDRSGQVAAGAVLVAAAVAWTLMLSRPAMSMPGMDTSGSGMSAHSSSMTSTPMGMNSGWTIATAGTFIAAWALMMAAMMLPSATPMIALFATLARSRDSRTAGTRITAFVFPYVALWGLTGIPVYAVAVWLNKLRSSHESVSDASPYLVAGVLLAAGAYQFSHLKGVCLTNCRNPVGFLVHRWHQGASGALRMGALHATYCVGCCALLMVVLVAAGSMGLLWVLLVAVAVLAEKVAPTRVPVAAITGLALLALGGAAAASPAMSNAL